MIMNKFAPFALVAAVLLSGASAVSAAPERAAYDNGTVRSQIDLNSAEGQKAFWESVERNGQ
jgi:hypothetical protein